VKKDAKGLHSITISYSRFFRIDRDFLMAQLYEMVNRLVDALVIFG